MWFGIPQEGFFNRNFNKNSKGVPFPLSKRRPSPCFQQPPPQIRPGVLFTRVGVKVKVRSRPALQVGPAMPQNLVCP